MRRSVDHTIDLASRVGMGIVRWTAFGVILVAAGIGLLFLTRGTAVQRVRAVGADAAPVAPGEPAFPLSVALLTGTPLVIGNRVELALDGNGTFPRLWSDLRGAREAITVQIYFASPGGVADTLAAILAERARAGVGLWLLYDAFGTSLPDDFLERLRWAGVRAVPFRPHSFDNLWVVQNRSHVHGIIIDGQIGWTGGFGIDDKWLGGGRTPTEWRETNARIEGPAVLQLQSAFIAGWTEATGELLTGRTTVTVHDEVSRSPDSSIRNPRSGARQPNAISRCRAPVRASGSGSRTPISRLTRTSWRCSSERPSAVSTCDCWLAVRVPTSAQHGGPRTPSTTPCCRPVCGSGSTNPPHYTRRLSSSTACGSPSAR